jgi:hypothetical protein
VRAALHGIWSQGTYQFRYSAIILGSTQETIDYVYGYYNNCGTPACYFDGGHSVLVGAYANPDYYTPKILAAGARETDDIYLQVTITYLDSNTVKVGYSVASRELTNQAPAVAALPTSSCSQYGVGSDYQFVTSAADGDNDQLYYRWVFGPGDSSTWRGPYSSGDTCMIKHHWTSPGYKNITVLAKDKWQQAISWSDSMTVSVCACGNANGDGALDISDAVFLVSHIFSGGQAPGPCSCNGTGKGLGDANGDGAVDISDAVYMISYIFSGGASPHCR